jgi:hypothetical protein
MKRINLEIFMDLNVFIPLTNEKADFVMLSVCMYAYIYVRMYIRMHERFARV